MNTSAVTGQTPGASQSNNASEDKKEDGLLQALQINLPKGGGAIRGIGEKFAANPVTGTGSMTVPIATSPGRSGFGPQLSLSYDSGSGNGPFGFGWSLSLPSITRKTDKGLPQYIDAVESDIFILSGMEDLVPMFKQNATGNWVIEEGKHIFFEELRTVEDVTYRIRRYRPRIEGLFARIERWTNVNDFSDVHWRSISKDNILTLYGKGANSRITDPEDSQRIFSWLICETRDDKGNAVLYEYKPEDSAGADLSRSYERNRGEHHDPRRTANRYLKRIRYGNRLTLLTDTGLRPPFLSNTQIQDTHWMFEVVFDYGEHDADAPTPQDDDPGEWTFREDPFSSYRAGFEVRTTRLCQRVLMFHHFPDKVGIGNNCLVRSTDFTYSHEQAPTSARNPVYTFLQAVSQTGYKREGEGYQKRSLPPVEFEYSQPMVQDLVEEVDAESLENLPMGLDGTAYQWNDLHGEGIPGILIEQSDAWFYKRNHSPVNEKVNNGSVRIEAKFSPVELVAIKPNLTLAGGAQFMDLAGDGLPDLVVLGGATPGLYEHDSAEGWQNFRPFTSILNRDFRDPNLKFVDLDGDGHADVLITENDAFVWYSSLAEEGFDAAQRVAQAMDEEKGPQLVFADGTQSIYLADLSGDGLTDLVRIRNGEVCYWPNLGYGHFGAKVTMEHAPNFDHPDQFDQKRIRLADIDGTGTTDLIYLHRDGIRLYFNQSGNSWSEANILPIFPSVNDLATITPVDLLGNGTACLVWSSSLPNDAGRQMRYIKMMGEQKPHLLIRTKNNLGAETEIQYASSTKFYLADKLAGKPWITKLPFPVHVVEKVTVIDKWRETRFSTSYSYHHGYFDGEEREFRGFGRVDQIDSESFGAFAEANINSPYITDNQTLYQPPVKTVTWFHTGAFLDREHILSQYKEEYFPYWYEHLIPDETNVLGTFQEDDLPEPDLELHELTTDEWRQALRSCKGMMLRQEIYELDLDTLERGEEQAVKLFTTAYHNCHIRILQPQATNRHAVFLVTESEAITYHYELDLRPEVLTPDPRIAHTFNLQVDNYGNVLQAVAVVYPRIGRHQDTTLPSGTENLIEQVQGEIHLAYTETRYTNDVNDPDNYRLRLPCEVLTYELTGIGLEDESDQSNHYFTIDELRRFRLSLVHQIEGETVAEIAYHELPNQTSPQKRLVEHVRMLFFHSDLQTPLALATLNHLALPFETYKLALTEQLLTSVLREKWTDEVHNRLSDKELSGYLSGHDLDTCFPGDNTGQYWMRAGVAGFSDNAAAHFFLPERYTDPFGKTTEIEYDEETYLFIRSNRDPIGNTVNIRQFDYRVLAPREMEDMNGNFSEVAFDVLGMPSAMAVKGKGTEADHLELTNDVMDPDLATLISFFTNDFSETEARRLLGGATARYVYFFGEEDIDVTISYGVRPACAAAILREQHVVDEVDEGSPLQMAFEYSDGGGNVLVKKIQAEPEAPGGALRWIANGKTILNNKRKPVKQYEPYFTASHAFEEPIEHGVTPIMYYDAVGRLIRTDSPDGSFSRVKFSPWQVTSYDANDTAYDPDTDRQSDWYKRRTDPTHPDFPFFNSPENQRAARLTAEHADTPATVFLDSLGRKVISVAHNRFRQGERMQDEKYVTFTKLDAEGKPLWIRDARGNLVMQYITGTAGRRNGPYTFEEAYDLQPRNYSPCYDIAGNLLFQHSMDAGDRWMINNASGQPFLAWDMNERVTAEGGIVQENRVFFNTYDALRRPRERHLWVNSEDLNRDDLKLIEHFIYGEEQEEDTDRNLRGQVYQHYDPSGLITNWRFDFKGNLLEIHRQLAGDYQAAVIDWTEGSPTNELDQNIFKQITEYDALNRMNRLYNWHLGENTRVAVYEPTYNERGVLQSEELIVGAIKRPEGYEEVPRMQRTEAIQGIEYNAKGQHTLIQYGNGTTTTYYYDPETFRLVNLVTQRNAERYPEDCPNLPLPGWPGCQIQNLQYTYDPVGNITNIRNYAQQTIFFRNRRVEPSNSYNYDALYRLIEATGREHLGLTEGRRNPPTLPDQFNRFHNNLPHPHDGNAMGTYAEYLLYDAVGNIKTMEHRGSDPAHPGWTRHYKYAENSNQLQRTWFGSHEVEALAFNYDTHGSMLNLNRTPEIYQLRWDYRDMIHHVNLGGGGQVWYNYDASKQRTRKRVEHNGSTVEERFYLGGMEWYRRWRGGTLVEVIETHHLFVDDQRVLMVEDVVDPNNTDLNVETLYRYQYSDHLGSVGLELDGGSAIISYEEYHPYGTTAYQANNAEVRAAAKRYRYTGMERDEETGLSYHIARFYLPWLGRWCSADPIGLKGGINFYLAMYDNPVKWNDLNGMLPPPYRAVDHPEPHIGDNPNAAANWRNATIDVLSRRYTSITQQEGETSDQYHARLIDAYHRELDELPRGSNTSGLGTQIGLSRYLFGRVAGRFYRLEASSPSYDYSENELLRLRRYPNRFTAVAPAEGVQLDHGVVRGSELARNPYHALDPSSIAPRFGHARGSGTHALATRARELHEQGVPNPGLRARQELGLQRQAIEMNPQDSIETYPAHEERGPQIEAYPAHEERGPQIEAYPAHEERGPQIEAYPAHEENLEDRILVRSGTEGSIDSSLSEESSNSDFWLGVAIVAGVGIVAIAIDFLFPPAAIRHGFGVP